MSDKIELDLDPRKVIDSLNEMGEETKKLAKQIDDSLGKEAVAAVNKLETSAEKGTSKISTYFRNLGTRVKEDLKTAFDATGIIAGAKFAKELGAGVKTVFDMEKAFDRLNTRLGMTGRAFQDFKKQMGSLVSSTGQKLEDVLPGVESASSRGGIKDASQLTAIGGALAQARSTTGEETEGLSDTIVEILKTQGKAINAQSFKETLDALQGTRVSGAFKTAGEAGAAVEGLSPYGKSLGLGTREMGGLAAVASRSGSSGQDILKQIMEKGTSVGGQQQLNAVLGQKIFKNGKLDAQALGKVDTKRFGNQQIMSEASGLTGANGADLTRFVEAFKNGADGLKKVLSGSNETASQFGVATDNLASGVDKFREKTIEAGREIGSSLSKASHELFKGNIKGATEAGMDAAKNAYDNKGTIAAAVGVTAIVGTLAGGGLKSLLSKIPGGGLAGGVLKGEAAKAAGIQPVYVTNASEIGGGGGGTMKGMAEAAASAASKLGKFGGAAMSLGAEFALPATIAVGAGLAAGKAAEFVGAGGLEDAAGSVGSLFKKDQAYTGQIPLPAEFSDAVKDGMIAGHEKVNGAKKPNYTNPSNVQDRGGGM